MMTTKVRQHITRLIAFCAFLLFPFMGALAQETDGHVVSGVVRETAVTARDETAVKRQVKGTVLEEKKKRKVPVSFCKILLTDQDGKRAARTMTLDDGVFSLRVPEGKYKALIECTGYKSLTMDIDVNGKDMDLGKILIAAGEEIEAAGIESESLISRKGTRIVYDVSKDPDAAKVNMNEMISRIPELRMKSSNGNLAYNNEDFGQILINDTRNGLINERRQYPMEFIKANVMRQVEVVLPGDLEYNNDKPILLISLSKALPFGFAANLGGRATSKREYSSSADAVINTPLIGTGIRYEYSYSGVPALENRSVREMTDPSSTVKSVESSQSSWDKSNSHNLSANFFRSFANEKVTFNATLRTSRYDGNSHSETSNVTTNSDGTIQETRTIAKGLSASPFKFNASARLSGYLGESRLRGHKWQVEYAYKNNGRQSTDTYPTYSLNAVTDTREHRVNGNFALSKLTLGPLTTSILTMAGFYDRHYYNLSTSPSYNNGLDYRQDVAYAKVIALGSMFDNKLGLSLSLNCEYLENNGSYLNGEVKSPLDYNGFNVNPGLSVGWNLRRGNISASYSRNVSRPDISRLNPYEDRTNPYHIRKGNPNLKGEKTDIYSISFSARPTAKWIQSYFLSVKYSDMRDKIASVLTNSEDGVATSTYGNFGKARQYGIIGIVYLAPFKDFSISLSASCNRNSTVLPSGMKNSYASPSTRISLSWSPKWIDINGSLSLRPSTSSFMTSKLVMVPDGELSVSRYFKKPRLGVSLISTEVFNKGGFIDSEIHDNGFVMRSHRERLGRSYIVRVYWRFGKFREVKSVEVKAYDM